MTVFLDMPPQYGAMLMKDRANKATGENEKDIHESDFSYLEKSYNNAVFVAEKFGWKRIPCVKDGEIRSIEEIHEDIFEAVKELI